MTADVLRDYVYERWYLDLGLRKDGAAVPSQGDQKAAKRRVLGMGKDLLTQMKLPSASAPSHDADAGNASVE